MTSTPWVSLQYLSDSLLASAKRRARIPDSAFNAEELLAIANEELETYLMPLIVSAAEAYYETFTDFALQEDAGARTVPTVSYRVPPRAVGNALREVVFLDNDGRPVDVPRLDVSDLEGSSWGVLLQAQGVTYLNRQNRQDIATLRMFYALTPSQLCRASEAAKVLTVTGSALTLAAIDSPPWPLEDAAAGVAPGSLSGFTSFDIVKSSPGFEVVATDLAGTCDGLTLTLDGGVPAALQVGDFVAIAGRSPVPQVPTALWGLLAQSIACVLLGQLGQDEAEQKEMAKRALMEKQVAPLIRNRVRGAPRSVIPRHNIMAASRRW